MKKLIPLLLVILVASLLLYYKTCDGTRSDLPDFNYPGDKVSKVYMVNREGKSVMLKRQADGSWTVNDSFPASEEMISSLLYDITNQKAIGAIDKNYAKTAKESLETYYTKVDVYSDDPDPVLSYFVGSADRSNRGNIMYMEGYDKIYDVQLEAKMRNMTYDYVVNENDWRSIWLMDYKDDEIQEVEIQYIDSPANSFKLLNTAPNYQITGTPAASTSINRPKTEAYFRLFERLPMMEIVGDQVDKEYQMRPENKLAKLNLSLKDGSQRTADIFYFPHTEASKNPIYSGDTGKRIDVDLLYVYTPEDNQMYVVQWMTFGRILRTYPEFFNP